MTTTVTGKVSSVRRLGKWLVFADIEASAGPVQLCFDADIFKGTDTPSANTTATAVLEQCGPVIETMSNKLPWQEHGALPNCSPFPHKRSDIKAGDQIQAQYVLSCRPSCDSTVPISCVVSWLRGPRPDRAPSAAQKRRAAKAAARALLGLQRAQRRLAWAKVLLGGPWLLTTILHGSMSCPALFPARVVAAVGRRISVSKRSNRADGRNAAVGIPSIPDPSVNFGMYFANAVASVSLDAFKKHCAAFATERTAQTVVASMVIWRRAVESKFVDSSALVDQLQVVALGVGTKFMPASEDRADIGRLCDSHAEVTARRGLLVFLYAEVERCWQTASATVPNDDNLLEHPCIFKLGDDGLCVLREGVTFHLYTSSAPCGNASLSRWTRACDDTAVGTDMSSATGVPWMHVVEPERQLFHARREGQIAALIKGSFYSDSEPDESYTIDRAIVDEHAEHSLTNVDSLIHSCDRQGTVPPGCSAIVEPTGSAALGALDTSRCMKTVLEKSLHSLSCSDKIARWQCLGLQGTLLLRWLTSPLYLQTVVVGRKFGRKRCERALCCRLQDFRPESCPELASLPRDFRIHHIEALGTRVLLPEPCTTGTPGSEHIAAEFADECGCWSAGARESESTTDCAGVSGGFEWHDGRTGLQVMGMPTSVSRAALYTRFKCMLAREPVAIFRSTVQPSAALNYLETKQFIAQATGLDKARQLLFLGEPKTKMNRTLTGRYDL